MIESTREKKRANFLLISICFLISLSSFSQKKERVFKKEFYFESAQFILDSTEKIKAYRYINNLKKFNIIKIEIIGYTDSDGSNSYNLALSKKRVNTLLSLLKSKGCESNILVSSLGEKKPKYSNNSKDKHKNRRVEVKAHYSARKTVKGSVKKIKKQTNSPNTITKKDFVKGSLVSLPTIRFVGGKAIFMPGAENVLKKVLPILNENKNIKLQIEGHVCCSSDMDLSIRRAKRVYDYLIDKGINFKRLTYKGFDLKSPLHKNINDIRNRRVEFRVLES